MFKNQPKTEALVGFVDKFSVPYSLPFIQLCKINTGDIHSVLWSFFSFSYTIFLLSQPFEKFTQISKVISLVPTSVLHFPFCAVSFGGGISFHDLQMLLWSNQIVSGYVFDNVCFCLISLSVVDLVFVSEECLLLLSFSNLICGCFGGEGIYEGMRLRFDFLIFYSVA